MSSYVNLLKYLHCLISNISNDSNTPAMWISSCFGYSLTVTSFSFLMLDSMNLVRGLISFLCDLIVNDLMEVYSKLGKSDTPLKYCFSSVGKRETRMRPMLGHSPCPNDLGPPNLVVLQLRT
ncbi:hypothetical protein BT93_I0416 [Corymbia citriodora subsp. variegata]|nr:hypothetical protein BT93_I0416 [Corymbia citriodora subsp. variegata]